MKTTIDIPDALLVRAKKRAAELRKPLRDLVIDGLKERLGDRRVQGTAVSRKSVRWVTHSGGAPTGVNLSDRADMADWLSRKP